MIFIFDWGFETTKTIGPLSNEDVEYNLNVEHVWLQSITQWFRVFFIPLIPTKSTYFLTDVDTSESRLLSKELFENLKPLAILNKQMMDDEISEEEYRNKRKKL